MHLAEHELSSSIAAVRESYGPVQARISAEDWLDESDHGQPASLGARSRSQSQLD